MIESDWLQLNTQHPMAIDKLKQLEAPKVKLDAYEETMYEHPTFTKHLNDLEISEHGTAVFECQVEPSKDPSMRIGIIQSDIANPY